LGFSWFLFNQFGKAKRLNNRGKSYVNGRNSGAAGFRNREGFCWQPGDIWGSCCKKHVGCSAVVVG